MKEQIGNALAWLALANAGILIAGTALVLTGVTRQDFGELGDGITDIVAVLVRNDIYLTILSPAIWLLLYIWTGSPRILPWRT